MSGPRRDRILAGTALALILAAPFAGFAQEGTNAGAKSAAVATGASPAGPGKTQDSAAYPGDEPTGTLNAAPAAPASPAAATEQSAAPDPLASLDPADRVVAEKIRDVLSTKAESIFVSKAERAAVQSFYQGRSFAPLWLDKGVENARAKSAMARLNGADADGLEAKDYRTPKFAELSADALAEADLKLTQTVLAFARHLQAGRFPYNKVSSNNIQLPQAPPDPATVLAKMVEAADAGKALDEYSPPHEAYLRLKAKLAEMRAKSASPQHDIAEGPLLKLNAKSPMQDPRVPSLRERLGVPGEASDSAYDATLAAAVRKFQQANELPATGNLDPRTIKELNGPVKDKQIDLVIANMERWRWYPRDLGPNHVIVNQPDFTLKVIHDGTQIWTTKVVIGDTSPGKQTPLLSETMRSITVNPTWNVPPSIVNSEYIPAMQRDPWALQRMGLLVSYNSDGSIHISQPPGGPNVLGRLRFNLPNRFLVYQHDTNEKFMFASDVRTFSHGCMRIQDPAKYAEVLLNLARPSEHWTVDRVTRLYSGGEQDIALPPAAIWVHVTYQSAFVDDSGKLQVRRDVYGLDNRTLAAVRSERGVIEPTPEGKGEQPEVASASQPSRRKVVTPNTVSFLQSFFFGAPAQARPVRPPRSVNAR
ncbi:MAG: L,D-transpeptidase YcbB [Alphaproteobacteria bacterium]|jgi:L,D-transpeptidase YcbB|nr:L,D-transpeptidase YcbB [Alphaproteobacteria bacterium]